MSTARAPERVPFSAPCFPDSGMETKMDEFTPRRAVKSRVKLKMAVDGASGSGKTKGALALAVAIAQQMAVDRGKPGDWKVLGVDTENRTMELYADIYPFDHIHLTSPYASDRYKRAMQIAVTQGYDVLVVDSISHQWEGAGGIRSRKDALDAAGGNGFANWSKLSPEHTEFIEFIKALDVHTICTMRSKMEYVLEERDGKKVPRKVGLAPIQREGVDYEFSLVFDLDSEHRAFVSKDRTELFAGGPPVDLLDPETARKIWKWLSSGIVPPVELLTEADILNLAGMMKANSITREVFAEHVKGLGYESSRLVPRSRLFELTSWLDRTRVSNDEKIARQSMDALRMDAGARALLIQKHRSDWPSINRELELLADAGAGFAAAEDENQGEAGEFFFDNGDVQCVVLDATRHEAAGGREFFKVTMNGVAFGTNTATCWHKSLFPALSEAKGQTCNMVLKPAKDNYVSIEDVTCVGTKHYMKGKIISEVPLTIDPENILPGSQTLTEELEAAE